MSRQVNYFSFGSSDEFSLKRQLNFCVSLAKFLECKFNFYCFTFPDEEILKDDRITIVPIDQADSFFEHFQPRIKQDTIVFNHAFFYAYFNTRLREEETAFIYHKLDIEFLYLKQIGTEKEMYEEHRKLESELLRNCDWMYTSSEIILRYFQQNEGYHQHKYSLLPMLSIGCCNLKGKSIEGKVHYVHVGPVSNRGIKYIKKILEQPANHITLLSDEVHSIRRQGFTKDNRFTILPFTEDNLTKTLSKSDYALIRPKADPSSWIRAERMFPELLQSGVKLVLPKDYKATIDHFSSMVIPQEQKDFNLAQVKSSEREKNASIAVAYFDLNEVENSFKFRNAKNIHLRLVSKLS